MIDQRLGNYRIVRELGSGGMGAVYEARHEQIGRRAAIKVLHAELARNPQIVTRFLNEARAANLVQHPGIVDIYEFGEAPDGSAYIVMQYLDGESLRGRLRRVGKLGGEALRLGRQLASALAAAHEQKIVHRDLKPENIMIVADPEAPGGERAKVLDFGIAKLAAELKGPGEEQTRTGVMMGTPSYMAPEQCRGLSDVNDRADVYALGIMLYEMVAGVKPFNGDMGELIAAHLYKEPPPLPGAPEIGALVARMLAKAPLERPSMRDVMRGLESLGAPASAVRSGAKPPPVPVSAESPLISTLGLGTGQIEISRPAWRSPRWIGGALAVLLLAGAGGLTLRPRSKVPAPAAVTQPPLPPPAASPPAPPVQPVPVGPPVAKPVPAIPKPKIKQRRVGKSATPPPVRAPSAPPKQPPAEEEYVPKRLR